MPFFVVCTFDLKNASSSDYQNAYADLAAIGLKKTVVASGGREIVAPTTMTMGEFTGADAPSVRDYVRGNVKNAFQSRQFQSEIFVVVAPSGWTWGAATS
jgi:hypothetical protein